MRQQHFERVCGSNSERYVRVADAPSRVTNCEDFLEKEESASDGLVMPENLPQVNIDTGIAGRENIDEDDDQTE